MANLYDGKSRDELLAEIVRWKKQAARNANTCMRYKIALKLARQLGISSAGLDGEPEVELEDWIDAGMKSGVPWPSSPFAQEWLRREGYSNCDGYIGIRVTMTLVHESTN